MIELRLPTTLRSLVDGSPSIQVDGGTVKEALMDLIQKAPQIQKRIMTQDTIHPYLKIFLNQEDVRYLQGYDTPLKKGDKLSILHPVAGG